VTENGGPQKRTVCAAPHVRGGSQVRATRNPSPRQLLHNASEMAAERYL